MSATLILIGAACGRGLGWPWTWFIALVIFLLESPIFTAFIVGLGTAR